MDALLTHLTRTLSQAKNQEQLVRPLLEMLEQVTQLESTYLTTIDFAQALQHVLYARNTQQMQIPEGLTVPWNDTLCQRALQEGRMCTSNALQHWPDSQAARALGIRTYVSAPVRMSDGSIYGTLCAASAQEAQLPASTLDVLQMFAQLIADHVEREQLLEQLQWRNAQLARMALTDPLTHLPNRTALREALQSWLARGTEPQKAVLLAFLDLDGFKQINDVYGHDAGDQLLCTVAQRLQACLRQGDIVARMGGDEFVFACSLPSSDMAPTVMADITQRLRQASVCDFRTGDGQTLHFAGASIGMVAITGEVTLDQALQQADAAMYLDKQQRRGTFPLQPAH